MFNKVLIANRGEIALRIIRACRELGINTVAVYSSADDLSLHKKFADEAICIGPSEPAKSYLSIPAIMSAAELTNVDAIHPGYGFLSESSEFAKVCNDNKITFIGPDASTIENMGNKSIAKQTMENLNVPVIPGSKGNLKDFKEGIEIANDIGYPVILKAASGGGGKGMRVVESEADFQSSYEGAQAEAMLSFNDDSIYLEKYFTNTKHIEIQIIADSHGNAYSLAERECSIQRRHQKIIEESPSIAISDEIRNKMESISVNAVKEVGYLGVGTIEYLFDIDSQNFYFMEMNTRIQVEHPVTEFVTNFDLIKNQILCHSKFSLPAWLDSIKLRGHSIECRINAEDPDNNFMPSPGTIESLHMPGGMGVRVDTHIYSGYKIPSNYDSMIAKIIVNAKTRNEAISRMLGALDECVIEGIKTTIPFQKNILKNKDFISGNFNTNFLNKIM